MSHGDSPCPPACASFWADTPDGPLLLSVPWTASDGRGRGAAASVDGEAHVPPDACRHVQLLACCEPLLCLLESWLRLPLDPMPVAIPTFEPGPGAGDGFLSSPGLVGAVLDDTLAPWGTLCKMAWPAALALPPPPPGLRRGHVNWGDLTFSVELARYATPPAGEEQLQPGAVLLLPQSFEPDWAAVLQDESQGLVLDCHWALGAQGGASSNPVLRLAGEDDERDAGPASDTAPAWRVVLDDPLRIPCDIALGWRLPGRGNAPLSAQGHAMSLAALTQAPQARLLGPGPAAACTRGSIVPVLQGAGLWLGAPGPDEVWSPERSESLST